MQALITGITGQDGSYLAKLLLSKGYDVRGCGLNDIEGEITTQKLDVIYNLVGLNQVNKSWENITETFEVNLLSLTRILGIAKSGTKIVQAGSVSMTELNSPYSISKASAFHLCNLFQGKFQIYNLVMTNHESIRRGTNFFSKKVIVSAINKQKIELGDLSALKDWGYAPDFVNAMYEISEDSPGNYFIHTGEKHSSAEFVKDAFGEMGVDYKEYITQTKYKSLIKKLIDEESNNH